jgi:methyl-accepting chemotaxis protein
MDQVTQQNAAMVEQTTAASHSLAREAEELSRLVGQFQLGADALTPPVQEVPRPRKPVPAAIGKPLKALPAPTGKFVAVAHAGRAAAGASDDWDEF